MHIFLLAAYYQCICPTACFPFPFHKGFRGLLKSVITHAGCTAAGVGRAFSCVCLLCLSVCPRAKRKTA